MLACTSLERVGSDAERVGAPRNIPQLMKSELDFASRPARPGFRARRVAYRVSLILLFLSAWGRPPLLSQESSREAELESIRDQIMVLRGRLNRVRQEAGGLRGDLRETEIALELQQKRLEEAQTARKLAEESLLRIESNIGNLEGDLQDLQELLRRRVADLHRLGQQGYVRLFLSIRSQEDLLPGIRQVRYLVKRDGRLLDEYQSTYAELSAKRAELGEHEVAVKKWLEAESSRLEQLERLKARLRSLIARLESEDRRLTRQTTQLADKEQKLANLIDFLYGRTKSPLSGTPVQNFRGVLDWPAAGRVAKGFGPRLDPRYGTQVPHNGIELKTDPGTKVLVVYPGKVLFAAPFQGFGLTVIVHHSGRVFTLYAGLEELRVRQDAVLSLGQVVGLSAETLYFEIRVENRPVDPLEWLR